jgi:protein dithiol oxidoreductase (disulfide-forming)
MSLRLSIASLALLVLSASAQASAVAGHDYLVLPVPQRQDANGKIEVIEFFSWGCPHCYEFSPLLARWLASLPKDITFKRVPVGLGHAEWESLARTYYALETTGDLARLDTAIFEAIHKEQVSLFDEPSITAWAAKHGVDAAKFKAAYHDFNTDNKLGQAEQAVMGYRIEYIPTLAIGGRYIVTGDHAKMLSVSDELIAKVRSDRKPASK